MSAWKPALVLAAFGLAFVGGVVYEARSQARRIAEQTRRAQDAAQRETQAKTQAAAAGAVAAEWECTARALQAKLAALPTDPGPRPVPPDAGVPVVVDGLRGLGIAPVVLGADPALGLTLPDSRTVLFWGREAQRVGPLAARLEACTALAQAQEGASGALHLQVDRLTSALAACDEGRDAERRRAALVPKDRPWTAGVLVGVDPSGARHLGAYVSRAWGPVQVQALALGNRAALGLGWRW